MKFIWKASECYEAFTQYLERYEDKQDQQFILDIKEKKQIRTLTQNRYYWAILTLLEEESEVWYDKDEWHDFFKWKYLTRVDVWPWWEEFIRMWSTASLVTTSFNMYIDKIKDFVISNNFLEKFPNPEDKQFMKRCEERWL